MVAKPTRGFVRRLLDEPQPKRSRASTGIMDEARLERIEEALRTQVRRTETLEDEVRQTVNFGDRIADMETGVRQLMDFLRAMPQRGELLNLMAVHDDWSRKATTEIVTTQVGMKHLQEKFDVKSADEGGNPGRDEESGREAG